MVDHGSALTQAESLATRLPEALLRGWMDENIASNLQRYLGNTTLIRLSIVASSKFLLTSENLAVASRKTLSLLPLTQTVAGLAIWNQRSCHAWWPGHAQSAAVDLDQARQEHGCKAIICVPVAQVGAITLGLRDDQAVEPWLWAKLLLLAHRMVGQLAAVGEVLLQDIHFHFLMRDDPRCPCDLCQPFRDSDADEDLVVEDGESSSLSTGTGAGGWYPGACKGSRHRREGPSPAPSQSLRLTPAPSTSSSSSGSVVRVPPPSAAKRSRRPAAAPVKRERDSEASSRGSSNADWEAASALVLLGAVASKGKRQCRGRAGEAEEGIGGQPHFGISCMEQAREGMPGAAEPWKSAAGWACAM